MEHISIFIHFLNFSILLISIVIIEIYKKSNRNDLKHFFFKVRYFAWTLLVHLAINIILCYSIVVNTVSNRISCVLSVINIVLYYICILLWIIAQDNLLEMPHKNPFMRIYRGFVGLFIFIRKNDGTKKTEKLLILLITVFITLKGIIYVSGISKEAGLILSICFTITVTMLMILVLNKIKNERCFQPEKIDIKVALENTKEEYGLTEREITVLKEVFSGKNNTQIAEALFISESTVKSHVHNLLTKMNSESRVEAVYKVFKGYFNESIE